VEGTIVSATRSTKISESYLDLVRAFPLRAIRTGNQAVAANRVLLKLVTSKPKMTVGQRQYVEALTALIRQYEADRPNSELLASTPLEILKHLMDQATMTVGDLGRIIGHQPTASQILRGERNLSKIQIQKLADHFKVSTDLFMDRQLKNYRRAS
jgi:antitoxin component HigA of HigAB toxin-antitoxin module